MTDAPAARPDVFIVEHRWGSFPWGGTRPLYLDRDEAERVARTMGQNVPTLAPARVGYQARVVTWAGKVLATYPRRTDDSVTFHPDGQLGERLAEIADAEGLPVARVVVDHLTAQLVAPGDRDPSEETF